MEEIVIQAYSIKELDKEVQQRILDKHRYINTEHNWYDCLQDEFKEELKKVGIEVESFGWDFDRDRHFYMISPHIADLRLFLSTTGLDKHNLAIKFDDCRIAHISITGKMGRYQSNYAEIDIDYSEEVECSEEKMEAINDLVNDMESEINNWLEDTCMKFLKRLESEYEYYISDEAVIDTLEANDYKFTKWGYDVRQ